MENLTSLNQMQNVMHALKLQIKTLRYHHVLQNVWGDSSVIAWPILVQESNPFIISNSSEGLE